MLLTELVRRRTIVSLRSWPEAVASRRSGTVPTKLRHLSFSCGCSELQRVQLQGLMATGKVRALKLKKGSKKSY